MKHERAQHRASILAFFRHASIEKIRELDKERLRITAARTSEAERGSILGPDTCKALGDALLAWQRADRQERDRVFVDLLTALRSAKASLNEPRTVALEALHELLLAAESAALDIGLEVGRAKR